MSKNERTERIRKAEDKVSELVDYILETTAAPDFVQCVGKIGGDVITYRVYNDGSIYER